MYDMLDHLTGGVSESLSATKNISTLVVARIPAKFVGIFFLLTMALMTSQISFSASTERGLVGAAFSNLPHLQASIGPLPSKVINLRETMAGNTFNFEASIKSKAENPDNPEPVSSAIFAEPQTLKTKEGAFKYTRRLRVFATSYDPYCSGCSGITALGLKAGYGVIAVDPNVIPLGTKVYVPGYGVAVAGDTGGSIKGAVVDLGFDNIANGWWSARYTDIYILNK